MSSVRSEKRKAPPTYAGSVLSPGRWPHYHLSPLSYRAAAAAWPTQQHVVVVRIVPTRRRPAPDSAPGRRRPRRDAPAPAQKNGPKQCWWRSAQMDRSAARQVAAGVAHRGESRRGTGEWGALEKVQEQSNQKANSPRIRKQKNKFNASVPSLSEQKYSHVPHSALQRVAQTSISASPSPERSPRPAASSPLAPTLAPSPSSAHCASSRANSASAFASSRSPSPP